MRKRAYGFILIVAVVLSLSATIAHPVEKEQASVRYIGVLPYYSPEKIFRLYKPLVDYLNRTTSVTWNLKLYHNYDPVIDDLCSGEIAIAYLGPNPFGLAHEKCGAKPLLTIVGSGGKPYYHSLIFTNDRSIKSLADLKGRKIALGDHDSTSSHIIPRKMLEDAGITLEMVTPVYYRNHEGIISAVARNEASAGATKEAVFEKVKGMQFKVIAVSGPLIHHAFCASPKCDPETARRFKNALLRLKPLSNRADSELMKNWDPELSHGFSPPPDDYIRGTSELHKLLRKYRSDNDD